MIGRRLAMLALGVTALSSGSYVAIYLVRWEWQRATFSAMVFLAAEVALAALWLTSQLRRAAARPAPAAPFQTAAPFQAAVPFQTVAPRQTAVPYQSAAYAGRPYQADEQRIRAVLAAARARPSNPFSWLDPAQGQANVFIPLLLGAGVLFSALAWLVERVAAAAAGPKVVSSMAAGLAALEPPARLVPPAADPGWAYRPGAWSEPARTRS